MGLRNFFWRKAAGLISTFSAICMRTIQSKIGNPLTKNHKNQPAFLLIYGHKRPVFVLTGEIFLLLYVGKKSAI